MEKAVIGLDIGTSSIKLIICDLEGKIIYSDNEKFSKDVSNGKTINPVKLFNKTTEILSRTIGKNNEIKIKAIGMSSLFPSMVALNEEGEPISDIFTWVDNRADPIVEEFKKNHEEANNLHKKTGCVIHSSYSLWKILWLKKNREDIFLKTDKFVSLPEYLTYKFTGKFVVSDSIASTTALYNLLSKSWDKSILNMAGIDESKLSSLNNIYHSEKMTDELCSKMGLNNETNLVLGAGDGLLCHIGSGCVKKGVMSSTIGTSGALRLISDKPETKTHLIWCYCLDDDKYILGSAINAGGSSLEWFKENFLEKNKDYSLRDLDKAVSNKKIGGPIFLPFLDGERGPNYNQNMVASFIGLSSKDDSLTLYRSVLEGIFFNFYSCYEELTRETKPSEIRASGGYVNSDFMLQMQSDIFNMKISVPRVKQAGALGAAIIALKSIGVISDISDFKFEIEKTFYPDQKKHVVYMKRYKEYKCFYKIISHLIKQKNDTFKKT